MHRSFLRSGSEGVEREEVRLQFVERVHSVAPRKLRILHEKLVLRRWDARILLLSVLRARRRLQLLRQMGQLQRLVERGCGSM